jgi:hypothetical protein
MRWSCFRITYWLQKSDRIIFDREILLLRTWGDVERSSPETDKSPLDDEFGGCCCCVKEIMDDVRRDLSFDPFKIQID